MKLPVYLYGHPVLRKISEPVPADYPDLKKLVADMFETMYASDGVGLAAPQVGLNINMVVIDADPVADTFPECKGRKLVIINPELEILDGEKVQRGEGCLSLPGISEDEDFNEHTEEISGFLARIVQHELDHLSGTLYIDHISPLRKQFIRGKLHNIIEGKTRCDYPAKYAPRKRK